MLRTNNLRTLVVLGIICFGLFGLVKNSFAASYYVKNGGNDSLDGFSDATAWATTAKVAAAVKNGDTVYFRSQDTWNTPQKAGGYPPVFNALVDGVTYDGSTYGSGTRAKFKASGDSSGAYRGVVMINASNIVIKGFEIDGSNTHADGITIGYLVSAPISNIMLDNLVVHNILDSTWHPLPSAVVTVSHDASYTYFTKSDSTDWTNPIYNLGYGSYLKWTGFTSPALNDYLMVRNVTPNVITVSRIQGEYTDTNTVTAVAMELQFGYGLSMMSSLGTEQNPLTVINNVTIQNSEFYDCGGEAIAAYQSRFYKGNRTSGVLIRNNKIHDNGKTQPPKWNSGVGVLIANDSDNVTVEYNNIYDQAMGILIRTSPFCEIPGGNGAPDNFIVRYNLLYTTVPGYGGGIHIWNGQGLSGGYCGSTWYPGSSLSLSGDIYGNIVYSPANDCSRVYYPDGWLFNMSDTPWNNSLINIYNNTFYDMDNTCWNTAGMMGFSTGSDSGWQLTGIINVKNNIFYSGNFIPGWIYYSPVYDAIYTTGTNRPTFSNNLIYRAYSASATHVTIRSGMSGYAYYDRAGGATDLIAWDKTAQKSDPLFTGGILPTGFIPSGNGFVSNSNYFAIASGDALNNGAPLGAPFNGSINGVTRPQGAGWDIGAYQHGGGDATPPASPTGLTVR